MPHEPGREAAAAREGGRGYGANQEPPNVSCSWTGERVNGCVGGWFGAVRWPEVWRVVSVYSGALEVRLSLPRLGTGARLGLG